MWLERLRGSRPKCTTFTSSAASSNKNGTLNALMYVYVCARGLVHSRHVPARVKMRTRARAREIPLDLCVCVCSSYVWAVQVIISVTGGAQAFDLPSTDKELIMKGLMDGTRTLKPIFITGGSNSGIMKYVGEARAKYNPTAVQT